MKGRKADKAATVVFWALGAIVVALLGFIIIEIFARGLLTALNPKFLFGKPEAIKAGGGIFPMLWSTIYLVILSLLISLPISIGAAIYMSEYSKKGKISGLIRGSLDTLATLPSIVFGLFGMALFVIYFSWSYCLLAGACTLAILNLPILLRGNEEALRQVPLAYREASMSLGASKWTTIRQVVVPSAMPGILTATILPIGRIVGESAAIIFTTGLFIRNVPLNPFSTAAPLAGYVWYAQTEGATPDYYRIVNGGAALLLLMVLVIYFIARYAGRKYQEKKLLGG
jgi:phosphate transport system permease protein